MNFERKRVAVALASVFGVGGAALLATSAADAQDVRVTVTGTNIKKLADEGALARRRDQPAKTSRNKASRTPRSWSTGCRRNSSIGGLTLAGSEGGTNVGYTSASLRGPGLAAARWC
jgi:hypothetical protein